MLSITSFDKEIMKGEICQNVQSEGLGQAEVSSTAVLHPQLLQALSRHVLEPIQKLLILRALTERSHIQQSYVAMKARRVQLGTQSLGEYHSTSSLSKTGERSSKASAISIGAHRLIKSTACFAS
jgi:hypothetical protein